MKNLKSFFAGMMAMVLIFVLAGTTAAASGAVQFNAVNVSLFSKQRTAAGSDYTAVNGEKVPSVLTYTDAAGKTTHYLPIPMLTDLLDLPITWNEKRNSLMIGGDPDKMDAKTSVHIGGRPSNPAEPELGVTAGPFTEVSPELVDTTKEPVATINSNTRVQTNTGYSTGGTFMAGTAEEGKYIVLTITNNGEKAITCRARRVRTLIGFESFSTVDIAPGKTLTRAFLIAEGAEDAKSDFSCTITGVSSFVTSDFTVSLKQYQ